LLNGRRQNIRRRPRYRLHTPYLGAGRFIVTRPLPSPRALTTAAPTWLANRRHAGAKGQTEAGLDVRFGSKADMCSALSDARFVPNSEVTRAA